MSKNRGHGLGCSKFSILAVGATVSVLALFSSACTQEKDSVSSSELPSKTIDSKPIDSKTSDSKKDNGSSVIDSKKISYIIGHNIGKSLLTDGVSVEREYLLDGLSQALEGKGSKFSEQEAAQALQQLQKEVMGKRQEASKAQAEKNEKAGKAFLAQNKSAEGWKELPSGLQYKIVKEGEGTSPKLEDTVVAHYTGTLLNGTTFDSSRDRGQPAEFQLSGLIKGWQEALQMMKTGARWELVVPHDLAYGPQGTGPGSPIGPNETLKFDIELLQVKSAPAK